jgi:LmbE family N-acetylglucosaminyl deacetylase
MKHGASRVILASLAMLFLTQCQSPAPVRSSEARAPVLVAIFAHPDDEASVGSVLAKYASAGVQVYLAVATDGRLGVNERAGIPAGDDLAAVRAKELQCAAERLGLQTPIVFGLHDQLKMTEGLEPYLAQVGELRERVSKLFEDLRPDAVITWPSSGWTGHPDHRIVSAVVTEVFERRQWVRPAQLYYPGVPTGRLPESHPLYAASMDPSFLNVEISVTPQDYEKAKQAWLCHQSQYTPDQIEELHQSLVSTQQGTAHFQPLTAATRKSTSLLPRSRL